MSTKFCVWISPSSREHWHLETHENGDRNESCWNLPVMMSTNSLVIAAWRPRLYCIVRVEIMSVAFLEALSIALRLERDRYEIYVVKTDVRQRTEHSVRKHDPPQEQHRWRWPKRTLRDPW